jgi:hypothetical protein
MYLQWLIGLFIDHFYAHWYTCRHSKSIMCFCAIYVLARCCHMVVVITTRFTICRCVIYHNMYDIYDLFSGKAVQKRKSKSKEKHSTKPQPVCINKQLWIMLFCSNHISLLYCVVVVWVYWLSKLYWLRYEVSLLVICYALLICKYHLNQTDLVLLSL